MSLLDRHIISYNCSMVTMSLATKIQQPTGEKSQTFPIYMYTSTGSLVKFGRVVLETMQEGRDRQTDRHTHTLIAHLPGAK